MCKLMCAVRMHTHKQQPNCIWVDTKLAKIINLIFFIKMQASFSEIICSHQKHRHQIQLYSDARKKKKKRKFFVYCFCIFNSKIRNISQWWWRWRLNNNNGCRVSTDAILITSLNLISLVQKVLCGDLFSCKSLVSHQIQWNKMKRA